MCIVSLKCGMLGSIEPLGRRIKTTFGDSSPQGILRAESRMMRKYSNEHAPVRVSTASATQEAPKGGTDTDVYTCHS